MSSARILVVDDSLTIRRALELILKPLGFELDFAADGAQVVCATHSPVLTALPGAVLLELGDHGVRRVQWDDRDVVAHQRRFLADPSSYLRHLL